MRKIAVVSDVHGNIPALEQVAAEIQRRKVDCVYNLGDHFSGPLWPKETARFLMRSGWVHIAGNHERELLRPDPENHGASDRFAFQLLGTEELEWLRSLPANLAQRDGITLVHGAPSSDIAYLLEGVAHGRAHLAPPDEIRRRLGSVATRLVLCGHSHSPRAVTLPENILLVNPGSVGLPAFDYDIPEPHIMETGSPHARFAVLEEHESGWSADLVALPYDHGRAAAQARKNGRPDWETALQTGFMK